MMNVTSAEETAATAVTISLFACVLSMTAIITSMCGFIGVGGYGADCSEWCNGVATLCVRNHAQNAIVFRFDSRITKSPMGQVFSQVKTKRGTPFGSVVLPAQRA